MGSWAICLPFYSTVKKGNGQQSSAAKGADRLPTTGNRGTPRDELAPDSPFQPPYPVLLASAEFSALGADIDGLAMNMSGSFPSVENRRFLSLCKKTKYEDSDWIGLVWYEECLPQNPLPPFTHRLDPHKARGEGWSLGWRIL
jgi:hypothetical protein